MRDFTTWFLARLPNLLIMWVIFVWVSMVFYPMKAEDVYFLPPFCVAVSFALNTLLTRSFHQRFPFLKYAVSFLPYLLFWFSQLDFSFEKPIEKLVIASWFCASSMAAYCFPFPARGWFRRMDVLRWGAPIVVLISFGLSNEIYELGSESEPLSVSQDLYDQEVRHAFYKVDQPTEERDKVRSYKERLQLERLETQEAHRRAEKTLWRSRHALQVEE